jgi:nitrite reductase/ring-hydroxylating ferredoxin subunit
VVAEGAPGGVSVIRDGEYVYCPWHQWGFELATGTTAVKPEWSIRTYPVKVLDHKVIVTA